MPLLDNSLSLIKMSKIPLTVPSDSNQSLKNIGERLRSFRSTISSKQDCKSLMQAALADFIGDNEHLLVPLKNLYAKQRLLDHDIANNSQTHSTLLRNSLLEEFERFYKDDIVLEISEVLSEYLSINNNSYSPQIKNEERSSSLDTKFDAGYKIKGPVQVLNSTNSSSTDSINKQLSLENRRGVLNSMNPKLLVLGPALILSSTIITWTYYAPFRCALLRAVNNTTYNKCITDGSSDGIQSSDEIIDINQKIDLTQELCDRGDKDFSNSLCSY